MISSTALLLLAFGFNTAALGLDDEPPPPPVQPVVQAPAKAPMLTLTKTCPAKRYVGRDATFEITVTNRGDGAAHNVVVTDVITGGTELLNMDNNGQREGGNLIWRLGSVNPGESRVLHSTVRCTQIGRVRNTATASYCVEVVDGCEFDVLGIPAILLECVDNPDPIEVNGQVTYTITVTNQGSAVGTNIVIECAIPAAEEYVAADGPTIGKVEGRKITFAPLASLPARAKAVYTVTMKGTAAADVRFGVQMKSDQMDSPVMETESTHIY